MDGIVIRKADKTEKTVIAEIVNVHLMTFTGFFLTFMGNGFLRQMYLSYTEHERSDIFVAEEDGRVVGFLAYSEHLSGLYKHMIKHRLVQFGWYSLGAFLRKPKVFFRLLRAFLKPGEAQRNEKYIELASIGVHPEAKATGIGSALIDALKRETNFEEFEYITLETDAENNEIANRFYVKNGFRRVREVVTHEGRKMFEYRYEGGKTSEASLHTEYSQKG